VFLHLLEVRAYPELRFIGVEASVPIY